MEIIGEATLPKTIYCYTNCGRPAVLIANVTGVPLHIIKTGILRLPCCLICAAEHGDNNFCCLESAMQNADSKSQG